MQRQSTLPLSNPFKRQKREVSETTRNTNSRMTLIEWFVTNGPHKYPYLQFAVINESDFLDTHPNYYPLKNPITNCDEVTKDNTWSIRQGESSPAWMGLRDGIISALPNPKVSASSLPQYLGLFLKKACELLSETKYNSSAVKEWESSIINCVKPNMGYIRYKLKWGNYHERNGLDALFKCFSGTEYRLELYEIGTYVREIGPGLDFLASPDGLFKFTRWKGMDITFDGTVEIKSSPCPWNYVKKSDNYKGFVYNVDSVAKRIMIYYYIPQVMMQMYAAKKAYALFIAWTPNGVPFVCMLRYNEEYVNLILTIIKFVRERYYKNPNAKMSIDPYEQISDTYSRFIRMTRIIRDNATVFDTSSNTSTTTTTTVAWTQYYDPNNPPSPSPLSDTWGPFPEKQQIKK